MNDLTPPTYRPGTLAYIDSFGGFIPCRVTRVKLHDPLDAHSGTVTVVVTGDYANKGYERGAVESFTHTTVVPRDRVRVRSGQYRIAPYRWAPAESHDGPVADAIPRHGDPWARTAHGLLVDLDYSSRGSVWFSTGARQLGSVRRVDGRTWLVYAPVTSSSPVPFTTRKAAWRYALDYTDALMG